MAGFVVWDGALLVVVATFFVSGGKDFAEIACLSGAVVDGEMSGLETGGGEGTINDTLFAGPAA
jgi:hypothetical protein